MLPNLYNSSLSSSDMDNGTLDERSESCDAVSYTEGSAEYEQRVFKGKGKGVAMEEGIVTRQTAGFDDGSSKMCMIWCVLFVVFAVLMGITEGLSRTWSRGLFPIFALCVPICTAIGAMKGNRCLLISGIVLQVIYLITGIYLLISAVFLALYNSTVKGGIDLVKLCKQTCSPGATDSCVENWTYVSIYTNWAEIPISLGFIGVIIFLLKATVKAMQNSR